MRNEPQDNTGLIDFIGNKRCLIIATFIILALASGYGLGLMHPNLSSPPSPVTCPITPEGVVSADCITHRMLLAAEAAASATRFYAWLSVMGLAISVGTLIGLWVTLSHNRRAIATAIKANDVASNNGQAQVRAYLVITDVAAYFHRAGVIHLQATFTNSGQSPARDVRWVARTRATWFDADGTKQTSYSRQDVTIDESVWRHEVAANSPVAMNGFLKLTGLPSHLPNSGIRYPVAVEILAEYRDVFKKSHLLQSTFVGSLPVLDHDHPTYFNLERAAEKSLEDLASAEE